MKNFFYSPDATEPASGSENSVTDTHTRHIANVPEKDATLLNVAETVNTNWAANAFVTLIWKTQADFANDVSAFKTQLQQRNTAGGKRSQQTQELDSLDIQIEDAVPYVKSYIADKFGPPNAAAHYAEFGLIHRSNHYELPANRQKRKDALRMMTDAMTANGFDKKDFGTNWWTVIKNQYNDALTAATSGTSDISNEVSSLVTLRTTLRRVLHSILLLLEANYPDTFDQQKRAWGFLKESY